jgi:hypothetical protein
MAQVFIGMASEYITRAEPSKACRTLDVARAMRHFEKTGPTWSG